MKTTSPRQFRWNERAEQQVINIPRKRASTVRITASERTNTNEYKRKRQEEIREENLHLRRRTNRLVETMAT